MNETNEVVEADRRGFVLLAIIFGFLCGWTSLSVEAFAATILVLTAYFAVSSKFYFKIYFTRGKGFTILVSEPWYGANIANFAFSATTCYLIVSSWSEIVQLSDVGYILIAFTALCLLAILAFSVVLYKTGDKEF